MRPLNEPISLTWIDSKNHKILVVDDKPINLELLSAYLGRMGFTVLVAESGERALESAQEDQPDIILLDVMMPTIDGYEICRRLKANPATHDIPVIFLTALADLNSKMKGFEAGAVDYITKPLQQLEVIARVNAHLTIRELQQSLHQQNQQLQQEIARRQEVEHQLRHDALHDALTGLPNRILFLDRLDYALAQAKRRRGYHFGLLYLDLDRFKVINDSLGHLAGDALLTTVAQRLRQRLRANDTIARLGGDEFTILLDDIGDIGDAIRVATDISARLAAPVDLGGHEVVTGTSIGIVVGPANYERPEELLRDADTAMYHAKAQGKGRYVIFDQEMHAHTLARLKLEADLRQAVERKEFEVFYQPIIALADGCITTVEALLRWRHPNRGLLTPDSFLPLAEETGLLVPISEWLMHEACAQVQEWRLAGHDRLRLAVNVSTRQLRQENMQRVIEQILAQTKLEPQYLELEVTEDALPKSPADSRTDLNKLSAIGIHISIDDFGTGYSSLDRLRSLPLNTFKIDRSFLENVPHDESNCAIARAIIAIGHSLKLRVVAEGVETRAQLDFLRQQGCDEIQGYYVSHPLPVDDLAALLEQQPLL
ncbi:MAG TPA: EAL domain-containing protein [Anaerolineae bacterium]|nr:EAL domain-containing protein [Anaerolineae bacterium]